jgi:hypothetical protein
MNSNLCHFFNKGKMFMLHFIIRMRAGQAALIITGLLFSYGGFAQVSISGPSCILPGTRYMYIISGPWNSASTMRVCLTGGRLDSGDSCSAAGPVQSSVFVTWGNGQRSKIDVASSSGNSSLSVRATSELNGGQIADSDRAQVFRPDQGTYIFHCNEATGGSCDPYYLYQWQKSENRLEWTDLEGAAGKDLQFSQAVQVSTYFRRVTIEARSNTRTYTDPAVLSVLP